MRLKGHGIAVAGFAALLASLTGGTVTAAAAAVPERGSFSFPDSYVDTEVCAAEGFAVNVSQVEAGDYQVNFNADGSVRGVTVHKTYDATISANGRTLHEADRWVEFYNADGSWREVGLTVHILGPGGIVQRDAGQIVFDAEGNVRYINGPHPQFLGETFCSALA